MIHATPAVLRAVDAARLYALARQAQEVEPLDLLHGLLLEEDGSAMTLCRQFGLDAQRYQRERGIPPSLQVVSPLKLATEVERLLVQARSLATDHEGERLATSAMLVPAILRESPEAAEFLAGLGLDIPHLYKTLHNRKPSPLPLDEPLQLPDLTERRDVARIIDAAGNRAREGLRVIEDYTRFVLDDAFLSTELKTLRHDLVAALQEVAGGELLEARDTLGDVGTSISTGSEWQRDSLLEVVTANARRLQESLRSLEEVVKVRRPILAPRLEQMRYRAYTLERALTLGMEARQQLRDARLYLLLTGATCAAALDWTITEAASGGVTVVQLREKQLPDRELIDRARRLRQVTRRAGVLFIINDRPDIARLVDADGVHLGQDDLSVKDARRIVGSGSLIGVSTHTIEQVRQAILDGASYIGVGPTFSSRTKEFPTLAGLEFVRAAMRETTLPAFAIGGIDGDNVSQVVAAGARRIAVSQAIATAEEPAQVAALLREALG